MNRHRAIRGASIVFWVAAALLSPGGGAGPARAGDELTPPKPLASCMVQPTYPEQEKTAGVEGTVYLNVEVKRDGTVGKITLERGVEGHPAFTSSAVAAILKWCFEPAREGGRAVAVSVTIPVRFVLDEKK